MTLGERLRELRKGLRYTLMDVQSRTNLSVSFLSDVERGRTNPSLESLQKLAECYELPIAELLDDQDAPTYNQTLPPGFEEFLLDIQPEEDIKDLLLRVERRGQRRAETKEDWIKYYWSLKMIMGR